MSKSATEAKAAGRAISEAKGTECATSEQVARLWLRAAGLARTAQLAGATEREVSAEAGNLLTETQAALLAAEAMAKSYTLHSLCSDWDTLPTEWASVWAAAKRALRSVSQGGCGAAAAKAALSECGSAEKAAEALTGACEKAKAEKAKAEAAEKKAKREKELGVSGLLLVDVDRVVKGAGGLKGRTGWTPEALKRLREGLAMLTEVVQAAGEALGE